MLKLNRELNFDWLLIEAVASACNLSVKMSKILTCSLNLLPIIEFCETIHEK